MKFEWDEQKNQANNKSMGWILLTPIRFSNTPCWSIWMTAKITAKPAGSERLDAMTDDMIDTSDIPPLTDKFFTTAKWRMPKPTVKVTVEVEPEVVEWFRAQGDNYERYLAAALRIYAQAHQVPEMAKTG